MNNLTINREKTNLSVSTLKEINSKSFKSKTEGLLNLEFIRHLEYYPTVQNLPNIKSAMGKLILYGVNNMIEEKRTEHCDINRAKESINMIRMSLSCSNYGQSVSADQVIELSRAHLQSAWPFY